MGPDLELNEKSEAVIEVLASKENMSGSPFSGQKVLQPGTNYKDNTSDKEASPLQQTPMSNGNEDVEVNIIGGTSSGKALAAEATPEDVTECSSSFGDTGSDTENGSAFSDPEIEPPMYAGNASPSMCDDWCEPFRIRKKRLTIHWRRFIRPLMWRCKWIELQLKQLQSQTHKYNKELVAYDYRKQQEFAKLTLDGFDAKSLPLSGEVRRNKVMKRKKRMRAEEKCDLASYMSNHSVFSYYENKDRADGAFLGAVRGVAVAGSSDNNEESQLNDMLSSHDFEDNDKSLEEMIQKIEAAHLQVHKLKARIDKVISDNPGKFCSLNRLSMLGPSDGSNHYDLNPTSPIRSKNTFPVGSVHNSSQLKSEFNMGDLFLLESAEASHQEIAPLIESMDTPQCEIQWKDTKDGVLIHNQAAREELHDFENVRNQPVEKSEESVEVKKTISLAQVSEPDLATVIAVPNVQSTVKTCSTSKSNAPRNTRRGRRRPGSKRWSRRSSG